MRALAIAALVAFGLVFLIVVATSGGGGKESNGPSTAGEGGDRTEQRARPRRRRATYTVKPGDSLGVISQKTGVSIEDLEALNPDVDPQALDAGTKLKLR